MKYKHQKEYAINIAGLKRRLPIVEIEKDKLWIASFVMLGDTELNYNCAKELIKKFPDSNFDYLIVPEAKAIPLAQLICQLLGEDSPKHEFKDYIVLRKSVKAYMDSPLITKVKSITTDKEQTMVINGRDAVRISGKSVCTIDDVVSTGESYRAMINLVRNSGADISFAAAVLREGEFDISDIELDIGRKLIFLGNIPIFKK